MADNNLSRLTRKELLELLVKISEENDALHQRVQELEKKLSDRTISLSNAGSIAEAALKMNDVFEAAQKSADDYLYNVRILGNKYLTLCEKRYNEADEIRKQAEEDARRMKEDTRNEIDARYNAIETKLKYVYDDYLELQKILGKMKDDHAL
ncbi:MAG: hypothetical protein ACI32G_04460 [Bulleidia sp.]